MDLKGKPVRPWKVFFPGQFRRCPAAVCGNDLRHKHWPFGGREAANSRRGIHVPHVHEPEDLPRPGSSPPA
jgi:hypothetical protein